jgi:hypothetical protein
MDHIEAVKLEAVEKYALGELAPEVRDEFEAHYFECAECTEELKTVAVFVAGTRAAWREEVAPTRSERAMAAQNGGWFASLRPAVAVPVFATLLLIIGYQNVLTIPHLKSAAADTAKDGDLVSLIGADSRGAGRAVQVHAGKAVILELDIPAASQFVSYVCELREDSGRVLYKDTISAQDAKRTVHLIVPAGLLSAGNYNVVIAGETRDTSGTPSQTQIAQLQFSVEILP